MKKLKTKVLCAIFALCFISIFVLTGTYEQGGMETAEYLILSAINMLLLAWSGFKAQLLKK